MTKNINHIVKSVELEDRENNYISEWGIKHELNLPVDETNRTEFRRQRDRILYTGGFRRLQDKTQVIAATKNGDHRTRLTHTLEVEQISISIADALSLNRDLVSAIALGHDIGHTPFGHAAERFLNDKLFKNGGFSHAVQSVRYLSSKKIELSPLVCEGILKHDTDVYAGNYNIEQYDCSRYNPENPGSLESQVVYWADKLAYLTHDFEDFYHTNIYENAKKRYSSLEYDLKSVLSSLITEGKKSEQIKENISNFKTRDLIRNVLYNLVKASINNINNLEMCDYESNQDTIIKETKKRIKKKENELGITSVENKIAEIEKKIKNSIDEKDIKVLNNLINERKKEIKRIKKNAFQFGLIINFEEEYNNFYSKLRDILNQYYIGSPEVERSDAKAIKIVKSLYEEFTRNPKILPLNIQEKINDKNIKRIVADYIASMTDRYAEEIFLNLNSIGSYYQY
ncbi:MULTISPECIES: dGTP triphosphohydrolase [unclassified Sedimentibacter]|uniref:dGTP triphosphohydrolase n=1 Tax=unclassified Sedimentibacter TaxID=2649220 RepID=UPI0027DFA7C6|nr:dNTP triphosphohydrolase [Sedimentibacter sp. MB35-C1]WMJ76358.1 dNTP triphosphohydrolase [Sedimentibacter sp. MB35-C1]